MHVGGGRVGPSRFHRVGGFAPTGVPFREAIGGARADRRTSAAIRAATWGTILVASFPLPGRCPAVGPTFHQTMFTRSSTARMLALSSVVSMNFYGRRLLPDGCIASVALFARHDSLSRLQRVLLALIPCG